MHCLRGTYSIHTNPSKFDSRINTKQLASQAILEGEELRKKLVGKRILDEIIIKNKNEEQN